MVKLLLTDRNSAWLVLHFSSSGSAPSEKHKGGEKHAGFLKTDSTNLACYPTSTKAISDKELFADMSFTPRVYNTFR
jgi:hypothetical protein